MGYDLADDCGYYTLSGLKYPELFQINNPGYFLLTVFVGTGIMFIVRQEVSRYNFGV